jgi:hypothetical protein
MAPPKPRLYSGPVAFLDEARDRATTWSDTQLLGVISRSPYPEGSGVRATDWVELVAHVSAGHGEPPETCAERLALYVTSYREAHAVTLKPDTVKASQ